jgi:hypothetical protein
LGISMDSVWLWEMRIQSSDCVDQGWLCIWVLLSYSSCNLCYLSCGREGYSTFTKVIVSNTRWINLARPVKFQSQCRPKGKSKETGVFNDAHSLRLDNRVQLSNTLSQLISPVQLVLSAAAFELVSPTRPDTFHLEQSTQD